MTSQWLNIGINSRILYKFTSTSFKFKSPSKLPNYNRRKQPHHPYTGAPAPPQWEYHGANTLMAALLECCRWSCFSLSHFSAPPLMLIPHPELLQPWALLRVPRPSRTSQPARPSPPPLPHQKSRDPSGLLNLPAPSTSTLSLQR